MAETTIESLQVEIESSSTQAVNNISALVSTLGKLKCATKGIGLTGVTNQIKNLNNSLNSVDGGNVDKLNKLAEGIKKLSSCGNFKISSSIATQITNIGNATKSLDSTNFNKLETLGKTLEPLSNMGKTSLSSYITPLTKLPQIVATLNAVDFVGANRKLTSLVAAFTPLTQIGKSNLAPFITQLSKIPKLMESLKSVDMSTLTIQVQQLANAFAPLATQMQAISAGFASFPNRIQRLIQDTNNLSASNNRATKSYVNLWAKLTMGIQAMRSSARTVASWIHEALKLQESTNVVNVSLGEYTDQAIEYAEKVGKVMGINPSEWLGNIGVFNTIIEGFGVANDKAYIMSKNLTQLGYDLTSYYGELLGMNVTEAMQKLQSGISGELEPLRRLGYDLSVARLQEEALALGIEKKVSAMTQAEKSQLRYYAIMTQVTTAQGDMARTLNAPANQLRVLQAQVTQCAKALGNIFIPVLNAVLPYAIALAKAIRAVAEAIASFFGFKLPEIDYSGVSAGASAVGDLADNAGDAGKDLGNAAKGAKKLKNALLGIDELNIISPNDSSSLGSGGDAGGVGGVGGIGGGDLGFELPEYDFISNAISTKVDEILQKMKEWLGLTEKINTWGDFFHTRLGRILTTVGAIGLGFATWKIGKGVLNALQYLSNLKKAGLSSPLNIVLGISLLVTGVALEWAGIIDAIMYELNSMNFGQIVSGGLLTVGGSAFFGKGIAAWITKAFSGSAVATALQTAASNLGLGSATAAGSALGAGIGGIIAGLPMYFTGIWDAIKNGLNWLNGILIPTGSTMAAAGIGAIIGACGGPIGAGIGALIGLAVGLITDGILLVREHWAEITNFLENFFTVTIPKMWKNFTNWLGKLPREISKFFSNLWKPIKEFDWYGLGKDMGTWFGNAVKDAIHFVTVSIPNWFKETLEAVKSTFKTFFTVTLPDFFTKTIPSLWKTITDSFKSFFTKTLPEALSDIGGWFVDVGISIWDGIKEGWDSCVKAVKDFVSGFVDGFKEALGIHSPSTVFAEIGTNIVDGLLNGIKGFTNMMGTVKQWGASVVEWFLKGKDGKNIIDHFLEMGGSIVSGFGNKIRGTYTSVKSKITTWASGVKEWFTSGSFGNVNFSTFSTYANSTIEGFRNRISTSYTNVKNSVTVWASKIREWFTSNSFGGVNGTAFAEYARTIIDNFKYKVSSTYTSVKSSITTWASSIKSWFTGTVSSGNFAGYANDIINGFKNKISSGYTSVKSSIQTWASSVKSWFTNTVSYSSFYSVASDVVNGFKNGIGNLYSTCKNTISSWGGSIIRWFKDKLDVNSPSRVFRDIGMYTVQGFNNGIMGNRNSTQSVMAKWFDSFMVNVPQLALAVDTSAIESLGSRTMQAYAVRTAVQGNYTHSFVDDDSSMYEIVRSAVLNALNQSDMSENMQIQANKKEQTIVQIGNRTVNDAVVTQQKANGYVFFK